MDINGIIISNSRTHGMCRISFHRTRFKCTHTHTHTHTHMHTHAAALHLCCKGDCFCQDYVTLWWQEVNYKVHRVTAASMSEGSVVVEVEAEKVGDGIPLAVGSYGNWGRDI